MIYKAFDGLRLSALGMGAMRLPVVNGDDGMVDQAAVDAMVDEAMAQGVNYYDTAWGYHEGHSEIALGKALSRHPRESFYLADKFPGYDLANMDKIGQIFPEQLRKCGVEYFDFYLVHNVCEMNINEYLDPKYGIVDYLLKQKEAGRIRHLGFSAHGSVEVMRRFLEAYGQHMTFCQIQLNWIDWDFQNARGKVELLREFGLPVWVMEPVRGGMLCRLSEQSEAALRALRPDEGIPAWSFRFIQSIPDVVVTLSGMSNMEQLRDNLSTFAEDKPLNERETAALADIARSMMTGVPCTACRYCTTHCPQGLDIPELLKLYNEHSFTGGGFIAPMALMAIPSDKQPSACLGCRSCEAVCPQQIRISEALGDFVTRLNG